MDVRVEDDFHETVLEAANRMLKVHQQEMRELTARIAEGLEDNRRITQLLVLEARNTRRMTRIQNAVGAHSSRVSFRNVDEMDTDDFERLMDRLTAQPSVKGTDQTSDMESEL